MFVDESFSGDWNKLNSDDPSSVMSRTEFVIKHMNCPIFWTSKLQTEISLSTMEADYVALSHCMCEVIPFLSLIQEIHHALGLPNTSQSCATKWTVFEDSNGSSNEIFSHVWSLEPNTLVSNIITLGAKFIIAQSTFILLTLKINK